ncbi:S1C family serine protease [Halalkalibacterium ligniniphilum]|uniref:S1C family serine protease n=1 Tax=Halalkalibacterium ligniniphilum TaxID=1134413 RepID=UPI000348231F|nr:trypsin-like peptidase domain-containing protein [Halalkalibacterium ligniniphilum]
MTEWQQQDKKEKNEQKELHTDNEPSLEDFLVEEEEDEKEIAKKKKHARIKRMVAIAVAGFLILNVFGLLLSFFNFDTYRLWQASNEFSDHEHIQEMSEAVVTIRGEQSRGTGFAIRPDGLIVTNHHVIDRMLSIVVAFPDGQLFEGEVVESYPDIDLAFLKIEGEDLPFLPLSETAGHINEKIYVIGNPLSQTQIVNDGVILEQTQEHDVIQISNPIYSGHSGSPVLNDQGEVVGVVYARTIPGIGSGEDSRGLAIPAMEVLERLEELNIK